MGKKGTEKKVTGKQCMVLRMDTSVREETTFSKSGSRSFLRG
jgi:hypothetical protein